MEDIVKDLLEEVDRVARQKVGRKPVQMVVEGAARDIRGMSLRVKFILISIVIRCCWEREG